MYPLFSDISTILHIDPAAHHAQLLIVEDAGFEPRTSVPEVGCANHEPSHLHQEVTTLSTT